jgi:hypothetical protein
MRGVWSGRRIDDLARRLPRVARYLEIGVANGRTIETVRVATRWGVDPKPAFDVSRLPRNLKFFQGTSDQFFEQLDEGAQFDVIFIDGLHTFEQTYRDLVNSLAHMRDGAILIDDTVPCDEVSAIPDQAASVARRRELGLNGGLPWHGDVWKLVACLARHSDGLDFRTILGSGNPQTLVWRTQLDADGGEPAIVEADLDAVAGLSYQEEFAAGLPQYFRPSDEHDAIAALLNTVGPRRVSA